MMYSNFNNEDEVLKETNYPRSGDYSPPDPHISPIPLEWTLNPSIRDSYALPDIAKPTMPIASTKAVASVSHNSDHSSYVYQNPIIPGLVHRNSPSAQPTTTRHASHHPYRRPSGQMPRTPASVTNFFGFPAPPKDQPQRQPSFANPNSTNASTGPHISLGSVVSSPPAPRSTDPPGQVQADGFTMRSLDVGDTCHAESDSTGPHRPPNLNSVSSAVKPSSPSPQLFTPEFTTAPGPRSDGAVSASDALHREAIRRFMQRTYSTPFARTTAASHMPYVNISPTRAHYVVVPEEEEEEEEIIELHTAGAREVASWNAWAKRTFDRLDNPTHVH